MTSFPSRIFEVTAAQLQQLRAASRPAWPEMEAARLFGHELRQGSQVQRVLQQTEHLLTDIESVPQTTYISYRLFQRTGDRSAYEIPYFLKRSRLSAAALRVYLGQEELLPVVQNYLWSICEESNWVLPAHERDLIDLFAAETGFLLAETLALLGDVLGEEIRNRVRGEVERRIFYPYLHHHRLLGWVRGMSNWNGVCNSSVAAAFLLLEPEPLRIQQALELAFDGLTAFLKTAFEDDGSSTEGIVYWNYGLLNFVALAELLFAQSDGAIDLLAGEKMRQIAAFPAKLQLAGSQFATFSDCDEEVRFHPGVLMRLARRTGEASLLHLFPRGTAGESDWRLSMMLRDIFWWDGTQAEPVPPTDVRLPIGGTARLVSRLDEGESVVLCIKAGHNDEPHNHNDIGSFLLYAAGESFLVDPGKGLYTRDYFNEQRYTNLFANSYGHGVPRIDGQLQGTGRSFAGSLLPPTETDAAGTKRVGIEFAAAYPPVDLAYATRELQLTARGEVWLHDHFQFTHSQHEVEEAFLTWMECEVHGSTARIHGVQHDLLLTIEAPAALDFHLEKLEEACKDNQKVALLKRLSFGLAGTDSLDVRVQMTLLRHATEASAE